MKRYVALSFIGILIFLLLTVLYQKSESQLTKGHQSVLQLFLTAKQVEATLEKDLLKSRNFLLLTYDPLVNNERDVEEICANLHSSNYAVYNTLSKNLDLAIDEYCRALEKKLVKVELFKSRNAILRNSLYYLQKTALENTGNQVLKGSSEIDTLIKIGLAYALVTTPDSKEVLRLALENIKKVSARRRFPNELEVIISHVSKIYEIKGTLDLLTEEIVNSTSSSLLENVRENYFQSYIKAESTAHNFKNLLFIACLVFLGFIIYNIILLWRAAKKITDANASLEQRVLERTKELSDSQETIIQQQQILISSAKLSSLGEMAGGIAHEINTPLAIISMKVEQLSESVEENDFTKEEIISSLLVIGKTTERIAKIINGLRFFARDGKTMPTQLASISGIVKDTLSFCQERFTNHGVQLEIKDIVDENVKIHCRSVEISQVLLNLLNNAFDAIEKQKEKWVHVSVIDRNEFIELVVTDSGPGIPKDLQDKIMQPFFTTKDIGKGTGLGLSISRGIIEAHQGKFFLDPNSSTTCFTILLPKEQSQSSVTAESL